MSRKPSAVGEKEAIREGHSNVFREAEPNPSRVTRGTEPALSNQAKRRRRMGGSPVRL
jgi:hypothetical protein